MSPSPSSFRSRIENAKNRIFAPESLSEAEQTPYEVIDTIEDLVKLRYYPPLAERSIELATGEVVAVAEQTAKTPLVIVSPLAVNMAIYDLFPKRSLVRYLRARGFPLYLVDWGRPRRRHDELGLASYFAEFLPQMLAAVRRHSGAERLSLHGWSLGGLFSLCYAALGDDPNIANLVLVASPFDYFQNGRAGQIYRRLSPPMRWLRGATGLRVHQANPAAFRTAGWANSLGFKLLTPFATAQNYWQLFKNMHDDELVRAHATNGAFLDDMVAYPGRVNQDVVHYLLVDNVLARGTLPMNGARGSVANVKANILNIAGSADIIVTQACSEALRGQTASRDTTFTSIDAGHISIVSSTTSQRQTWGPIVDWLLARDE